MENKIATVDIETSGLLSEMVDYSSMPYKLKPDSKIWVISVCDISANKVVSLSNDNITREAVEELLRPYDTIVLQNGLSFDLPALQLFGLIDYKIGYLGERDLLNGKEVRILDTLIMSRFINPDRLGGHSLGAWGNRVGSSKTDYRGELVELGVIDKSLPKGEEFRFFHPLMVEYCEQDTIVTAHTYRELLKEYKGYSTAKIGLQLEHKLADLAVSRENLGFWFDKDLAIKNLEFLNKTMEELANSVNPILPRKKKTKTDISNFTPPKQQFKKDGTWSNHMLNFFKKMDITEYSEEDKWFKYKGNVYECPYEYPLEWEEEATIDDLDVVKHTLIDKGWIPTEWKDRDLTKDSKKQVIPIEKRRKALEKYVEETLSGKYKDQRLDILGLNEDNLLSKLSKDILGNRAVKVPTSPCIKVGVTKEMCPNLIKLGEEVSFAKEVADYYTYRHRRSAIAGGDTTELDFEDDIPETGYLAQMREEDGRIPTPAIEIGASTHRYKHIGVANVPRASSLFGKEMRSLFGAGDGFVQFGFDYASLEARIEGHYVFDYEGGEELAVSLLAEKPNDIHSLTGIKMGIPRDQAKSVNYAILYGASANKFVKMLGMTKSEAEAFYKNYWDSNPSLKQLKEDKDREWLESGKRYILSIDGRRINIRSQHSILNALFQSSGVICAKYVMVLMFQKYEEQGYCVNPFKGKPDIAGMIEYHDENQLAVKPSLLKFKRFNTKEEGQEFISSWTGEQLGALQESNSGFYITMPTTVSRVITESISQVEKMFNMRVGLGYEYVTGRNWYDCH